MKVLHVFNELKFSGAEIMYANAAKYFQEEEILMFALATGNSKGDFESEFLANNIKVYHAPSPSFLDSFNYVNKMISFIRENEIEIVHIHRADVKWLFAFIARLASVKCMYTVHNVFKHRRITWIKGFLERYTARKWFGLQFQTIGESVYENELNYYKTPSIKVNNWYDSKLFYPSSSSFEKEMIRKELNIDSDSYVIISIGGCSYVKNHHDILKVIPLLKRQNIIYLHLGCGVTEQEEIQLAEELGISNKVMFLGNKINVRDFLVASDLYVMTSRFEGLGMATVEAMATNIPAVLYHASGSKDLIVNKKTGLLIGQSLIKLEENINWVIENKEKAKEMADLARAFVEQEFDIEKNVSSIIGIYRSL